MVDAAFHGFKGESFLQHNRRLARVYQLSVSDSLSPAHQGFQVWMPGPSWLFGFDPIHFAQEDHATASQIVVVRFAIRDEYALFSSGQGV